MPSLRAADLSGYRDTVEESAAALNLPKWQGNEVGIVFACGMVQEILIRKNNILNLDN